MPRILCCSPCRRPHGRYKTHGAFSWNELTTADPAAAAAFYGQLFGWQVKAMDMGGGPYHVVKVGDAEVGGIMTPPPGTGMPPTWGCYDRR